MIIEARGRNSQINFGKAWCESCSKTLRIEEAVGFEALEQSAIDLLLGIAAQHEQKHPKHKIYVTIYDRVPTIQELRGEFRK